MPTPSAVSIYLLIKRNATIKVGAGQYKSSKVAITMLPMMPPNRAATIDIATPVALFEMNERKKIL